MKCYYHNNREATAQCTDCGKYLCGECASHFEQPLCADCAQKRNGNLKSMAFKNLGALIAAFVIAIVLTIFVASSDSRVNVFAQFIADLLIGLALAGIPTGWRALNKITPSIFLILPLIGWVIYFLIKGVLSMAVGIVLLPVRTVKGLLQYARQKAGYLYFR